VFEAICMGPYNFIYTLLVHHLLIRLILFILIGYTTSYGTLMARSTTKKIAAAVNQPGWKAATASALALQEQCEEARQTLLKAKATQSQYSGYLERADSFLRTSLNRRKLPKQRALIPRLMASLILMHTVMCLTSSLTNTWCRHSSCSLFRRG
jgi:hypothetical protein